MKLKDSTFAIIAEKKDSISHKWIKQFIEPAAFAWNTGCYYEYNKGEIKYFNPRANEYPAENVLRYTESEFEALIKAEELSEMCETSKLQPKMTQEQYEEINQQNPAIWKHEVLPTSQQALLTVTPKQITISYNLAIEYLAERLNVDKGIIKIEMP